MRTSPALPAVALNVLVASLAAGPALAAQEVTLDPALCAPDQHEFTLHIDNAYFPLPVGQRWILIGKEQGARIGLRITVLDDTESLYSGSDRIMAR